MTGYHRGKLLRKNKMAYSYFSEDSPQNNVRFSRPKQEMEMGHGFTAAL